MAHRALRVITAAALAAGVLTACTTEPAPTGTTGGAGKGSSDGKLVLGFAQVGAESGWRTANTTSVREAAEKAGITLKFSDAQQKQENQIKAIRTFIQQKVDVIAFSPVVESGWDTVLKEAKSAGIPVILTDRAVDSQDTSLYRTFLGSDFVKEGQEAGKWLLKEYEGTSEPVNVVELQGTTGSAPANDRKAGFAEVIKGQPKFKVVASQTGDFTRAKGKEVMQAFLKSHKDIDVLYAHNDDMALGAIQAIEEAGKKPGTDIKVISVDGIKDAFVAMQEKKINVVVECNPLLGDQLMELAKKVAAGESVPRRVEVKEGVFTQDQAAAALPGRQY
ncbi:MULTISPECIES: ABC transporter substrate-binding protein [Streptomyces]|uniref:ABC transporter periplasmic-binding protein YtfQ n=1 Tax=Streptomyces venezuelae (strain ATCC 10712 / CBS 650.69 / DSM 40230 / JCM 4526 / NBRC 13096 / PD 04745) TaxID=953739 RepID=F2RHQ9_STRVP|nr:ABC transporter substrate-binding protein [Streptomyces venezuelae]APE25398.1 LacI family transcriptional regulator [Streptomyces venezuelae]QES02737.1 ABC transporter substrate-binding protein [Streptomyces venezuelae ATCC 10712]CCA60003.1 ABC transporter periplasmic-binding protein YtfQ [Streptomyces venezuelae ATCC 10712]